MIKSKNLRPAAAAAALALTALAVASAQASTPAPAPDLSKMTLQRTDLAAAGTVASISDPPGPGLHESAQYERDFIGSTAKGGVKLSEIQTTMTLADTPAFAQTVFAQVKPIFQSSSGHAVMLADAIAGVQNAAATQKASTFGRFRSIGVGQQSLFASDTIRYKGKTIICDFVWLRIGDVFANLIVTGDAKLADAVPIALAHSVAGHIQSVLAAASK